MGMGIGKSLRRSTPQGWHCNRIWPARRGRHSTNPGLTTTRARNPGETRSDFRSTVKVGLARISHHEAAVPFGSGFGR